MSDKLDLQKLMHNARAGEAGVESFTESRRQSIAIQEGKMLFDEIMELAKNPPEDIRLKQITQKFGALENILAEADITTWQPVESFLTKAVKGKEQQKITSMDICDYSVLSDDPSATSVSVKEQLYTAAVTLTKKAYENPKAGEDYTGFLEDIAIMHYRLPMKGKELPDTLLTGIPWTEDNRFTSIDSYRATIRAVEKKDASFIYRKMVDLPDLPADGDDALERHYSDYSYKAPILIEWMRETGTNFEDLVKQSEAHYVPHQTPQQAKELVKKILLFSPKEQNAECLEKLKTIPLSNRHSALEPDFSKLLVDFQQTPIDGSLPFSPNECGKPKGRGA